MIEAQLELASSRLSNQKFDELDIKEEFIEDAVSEFREALKRQLTPRESSFRLRMSNIGKPRCQLQKEKAGATRNDMPYNHWMRMVHGDITEILQTFLLRISGADVTGGKQKVSLKLGKYTVEGEDDIHIDGKVYDIKSSAPWAFANKWSKGFNSLKESDDFGYIPQLVGYAKGQGKEAGGWIVMDKSTGGMKVVECDLSTEEEAEILSKMKETATILDEDRPFEKCFELEDETFRRVPTGKKKLAMTCTFCQFLSSCWPNAELRPQTKSQAQNPRMVWYAE